MEISHPNVRFDWYQTETHVVLSILVKQVKPENVRVDLIEKKLTCNAKLPDESDFSFGINLSHQVLANQINWKVFPSKIEIKLKKLEDAMWSKLEGTSKENEPKAFKPVIEQTVKEYPSSKPQKKDWDKIAQEIKQEEENEKLEGDAALNQLFQKIYSDGSDETRKAMNKSFLESGGTVLSTSWNEVAAKKVEVKPPDGMEFKKWE